MTQFDADPLLRSLYAGVLAAPADDHARLVMADALGESSDPAARDLEAFIRTQFELHRIGPPRLTVERAQISRASGPDYYVFDVDADAGIVMGARIDVGLCEPQKDRITRRLFKDKQESVLHGLSVRGLFPAGFAPGLVTVHAVKDAESAPYPAERVAELRVCEWRLVARWLEKWGHFCGSAVFPAGVSDADSRFRGWWYPVGGWGCEFERGFASRYVGTWAHWSRHGTELTRHLPLTHVTLWDRPFLVREPFDRNRMWAYRFGDPQFAYIRISDFHVSQEDVRENEDSKEHHISTELCRRHWPTVSSWFFPD